MGKALTPGLSDKRLPAGRKEVKRDWKKGLDPPQPPKVPPLANGPGAKCGLFMWSLATPATVFCLEICRRTLEHFKKWNLLSFFLVVYSKGERRLTKLINGADTFEDKVCFRGFNL